MRQEKKNKMVAIFMAAIMFFVVFVVAASIFIG
jgi:hypothetical protein